MKKKILFLLLTLMLVISMPIMAGYESKVMDNGGYKVTFRYDNSEAEQVYLRGEFNNWDKIKMKKSKKGIWKTTLDLAPGSYQYMYYLESGKWVPDSEAETIPPDGNSIVRLKMNEKYKKKAKEEVEAKKGTLVTTKKVEAGYKFIFNPKYWGIEEEIKEVHLVGAGGGLSWDIRDKSYSLEKNKNGIWTGIFDIPKGTKFKFVYNNAQNYEDDGDQVVGIKVGASAEELVVGENVVKKSSSTEESTKETKAETKKGTLVMTKKVEDGYKFIFNPKYWGIEEEIKEVHLVGAGGGLSWDIHDKSYSLEKNKNGIWTGVFDIPKGTKFKFVYNNAQNYEDDGDQVVGIKVGASAEELVVGENN